MKPKTLCLLMGLSSVPLMAADVPVTANIATDTTWTADNTYLMDRPVFVTNGATLTIQPGTTILGEENVGNGTFGSLIITRNAKIIADGTADAPIIFTARAERDGIDGNPSEKPDPALGDASFWGGLILLGNAQVNNYAGSTNQGEARIEGFPSSGDNSLITYGGANNADNSGVLRYVSLRFGGFEFAPNNEINGLTLGGVGSGTTIENVEIVSNSDDGVEFFGGTVNTKRIAVAFCQDESFDIDQGHAGFHQFWFAIQNSNPNLGDYGGEWDGGGGDTISGTPYTTTSIYNLTMIGTGASASGSIDDAIQVSDNFAGTLANSVLHDFNGVALSNTGDGVGNPKPTFLNNTWGSFGGGAGILGNIGGAGAADPAGANNGTVGVNPMFRGVSRIPDGGLDPRPANGSPLLTAPLAAFPAGAPSGFYETVSYRGAFGTAVSSNWLKGWSYLDRNGYLGSTDVPVAANLTTDTTWTADNTYLMDRPVFVTNGARLTIQPGTTILGEENVGNGTFGSLIITRNAKIIADGTADAPIVFTARAERDGIDGNPAEKPDPALGDASFWGGLILLGNAQVNNYAGSTNQGEARIEGFPSSGDTSLITYGGSNNTDNSGILRYVSLRFGGFEFAPNNEINGLTLGGVGSGTTIENVEVVSNSDDGVEFFGGTVNTKRIAVAFCQDESFDIDQGHAGFHQFWFAIQNSNPNLGDYGGEWDGGGGDTISGTPYTTTSIYNLTMIGTGSSASGSIDDAIQVSDNFAGTLANSVLHDFNGVALSNTGDGVGNPKPTFLNNTWGSFGGGAGILGNIGGAGAADPAGANNGTVGVALDLGGISRIPNGGLDPRPNATSPLYSAPLAAFPAGAPTGFYETVSHRGAFGASNWLDGWSYLSRKGYLGDLADVPVAVDSDNDGLSDDQEAVYGTNPNLADTDGDGVSDGLEVSRSALGFNPLVSDAATVFGSLYTEQSILEMSTAGQVVIQAAGSDVNLSLPVFKSNTLGDDWVPAGNLLLTVPKEGGKQFYRIQVEGAE